LEAAHIRPHASSGLNASSNGLLLRADLHVLFEEGLIAIEPGTLRVEVHRTLKATPYAVFHGKALRRRSDGLQPNDESLKERWRQRRP
jgi:hypothetical protein